MELISLVDTKQWNEYIDPLPGAHALQTREWGMVKAHFGWSPTHLLWQDDDGAIKAAVLILKRAIPIGFLGSGLCVMYAPRGPLFNWSDQALLGRVLDDIQAFARKNRAIFIKIDPDLPIGYGIPEEEDAIDAPDGQSVENNLDDRGWVFSEEQIQFRNTVTINLNEDEDAMLMRMKSKTRYNIRLAKRKGVTVRVGGLDDIDLLYQMYAHTAVRDDFVIRHKAYYESVWRTFFSHKLAEPLIAEVDNQPVGAVVIFRFGGRAWYFHGMSLDEHREKMFNYRLQWEAILRAKAAGCHTYDMWGAPDTFNEADPMWGVYRFKDGFGGQVMRTLGAWDYPVRPLVYRFYNQVLPRILNVMRKRGKYTTKRSMST